MFARTAAIRNNTFGLFIGPSSPDCNIVQTELNNDVSVRTVSLSHHNVTHTLSTKMVNVHRLWTVTADPGDRGHDAPIFLTCHWSIAQKTAPVHIGLHTLQLELTSDVHTSSSPVCRYANSNHPVDPPVNTRRPSVSCGCRARLEHSTGFDNSCCSTIQHWRHYCTVVVSSLIQRNS